MKLIIAMIFPDKLEAVRASLPEPDAYIFYVNLVGDVREPMQGSYRGGCYSEPRTRLRVEIIVVNEVLLDEVVDVVMTAASAESDNGVSSGNVFVLPLEQWVRIPTRPSGTTSLSSDLHAPVKAHSRNVSKS